METKDKIVPIEPTDEMARQGALNVSCLTREGAKACYRAMVYAAPEAAALSVQKQLVEALEEADYILSRIVQNGEYKPLDVGAVKELHNRSRAAILAAKASS